jgi:hypothetical protein
LGSLNEVDEAVVVPVVPVTGEVPRTQAATGPGEVGAAPPESAQPYVDGVTTTELVVAWIALARVAPTHTVGAGMASGEPL